MFNDILMLPGCENERLDGERDTSQFSFIVCGNLAVRLSQLK